MDRQTVLALAPHYAAMFVLSIVALSAWGFLFGPTDVVGQFLLIGLIVFSYRPVVLRLGLAPEPWRE